MSHRLRARPAAQSTEAAPAGLHRLRQGKRGELRARHPLVLAAPPLLLQVQLHQRQGRLPLLHLPAAQARLP